MLPEPSLAPALSEANSTRVRPHSPEAWLLALRPKTLTAAVSPVLVGAGVAVYEVGTSWLPAGGLAVCLAALGALLLQVASNFANDVFDYEKGADTQARLGPARAVQSGWVTPRAMRQALLLVLGLCLLTGAFLALLRGWPIVAIGLASMVAAVAYTAGPYPLGYHGLGDVFVFVFFGFVAVMGTTYVALGHLVKLAAWAALPVGALATAILVVNNLRDLPTDRLSGKHTLAVRLGERFAVAEYWLLLLVAYALPAGLALSGLAPWVLMPWLTLPWALRLAREISVIRGRDLNPRLASTAQLLAAHSFLFALGLCLS